MAQRIPKAWRQGTNRVWVWVPREYSADEFGGEVYACLPRERAQELAQNILWAVFCAEREEEKEEEKEEEEETA